MGACPSSASSTQSVECQRAYPKSCEFENALCLYPGMYCFHTATAYSIWLFKTECTSGFWAVWPKLSTGKLELLTTNSCTISVQRNEAHCWRLCFVPLGNSILKTSGLTRVAAESERIGMVDYISVFILQKILPSTISCSGFNQGLEISCTAHTGVDLLLPHLLLFPCQHKQQLRLAQTATERSRFLSGGKATN